MDYQQNTKENIIFKIKSLVPIKVLMSVVLHYITRPLYLRAYILLNVVAGLYNARLHLLIPL